MAATAFAAAVCSVPAVPAIADPVPSFTLNPDPPVCGVPVTATSTSIPGPPANPGDPDPVITEVAWDPDNDGTFDIVQTAPPFEATITPRRPGPRTIGMRVTDSIGVSTITPTVTVVERPPVVGFGFNPTSPLPGQSVLFASDSFDPNGGAVEHLWDFGDGVTSPLRNPEHSYATPGPKNVTLAVTDPCGATSLTRQIVVATPTAPVNAPPSASFAFSPRGPRVGEQVEFVSTAVDPEGDLSNQRWDLDGDGQFDDARGDEVLYTFASAGAKTVRLRVEDAGGAATVRERTLTVLPLPKRPPGFLSPFPVVRITGEVHQRGTNVRLLSVRAPRGTRVTVKCAGKGCPKKTLRHKVRRRPVHFKALQRMLRAGIRLELFITKPDKIGKYTKFTIRAGKSPLRKDRCLMPGRSRPTRCPG